MATQPRVDEVGESSSRSFRAPPSHRFDFISYRFSIGIRNGHSGQVVVGHFSLVALLVHPRDFSSLLMFRIPAEWGEPKEMRYGVLAGTIVVFLPQICGMGLLLCALWWIPVICGWVFVSTYQWKYDVQPFRTGLWLGVGGLVGMFMGSWAMSIIIV